MGNLQDCEGCIIAKRSTAHGRLFADAMGVYLALNGCAGLVHHEVNSDQPFCAEKPVLRLDLLDKHKEVAFGRLDYSASVCRIPFFDLVCTRAGRKLPIYYVLPVRDTLFNVGIWTPSKLEKRL